MPDLTHPFTGAFYPQQFEWGSTRSVLTSGQSTHSVNEQLAELPYSHRWVATLTLPPLARFARRADVEGELDRWHDPANRILLGHCTHPLPYGSMRGNPTLIGAHAQGASTLAIQTTASATVLRGDVLGVTTTAAYAIQLVRAAATAVADGSGVMALTITTRLRAAANSGAAVVWNRPLGLFRPTSYDWRAGFGPRFNAPIVIELKEVLA